MFKQASFRLSSMYLGIILFISMIFSISLYNISAFEITRFYQRQIDQAFTSAAFRDDPAGRTQYVNARVKEYRDSKDHLMNRLLLINLCILIAGGMISYYLARRTLRPIELAHTAQERFSADASHELRTPLAVMRTEIEVALMKQKLTPKEIKTLLHSNLEEIDSMTRLTESLLLLAHIKEQALETSKVSVATAVNEAIERLETQIGKKHIAIEQKIPKRSILFDQTSLNQIVYSLLDNAIKYSPEQSTVNIHAETQGKYSLLHINNQGPAIDPIDLQFIFDRFYRTDTSRQKHGGFGLGLAIAKQLAELNNAKLLVTSNEQDGTTFTLRSVA